MSKHDMLVMGDNDGPVVQDVDLIIVRVSQIYGILDNVPKDKRTKEQNKFISDFFSQVKACLKSEEYAPVLLNELKIRLDEFYTEHLSLDKKDVAKMCKDLKSHRNDFKYYLPLDEFQTICGIDAINGLFRMFNYLNKQLVEEDCSNCVVPSNFMTKYVTSDVVTNFNREINFNFNPRKLKEKKEVPTQTNEVAM